MNPRITFGAAGLLSLAVLTAGGVALAATPSPTAGSATSSATGTSSSTPAVDKDITLPAGGVLAARTTAFCERSDKVVDRLTERQAKVDKADPKAVAAAKAKREKRVAKLREHNFDKRADTIEKRVERRTERVGKLPERLTAVKAAAAECDSLGLS